MSVCGRIVLHLPDPDVATNVAPVRLWRSPLIVERCDVMAHRDNAGTVRIGCANIRGESTAARGEELEPGLHMTLPRTNLAWWYVVSDTEGDVVTWAGEQEVDADGRPIDA